MKTVRSIYVPNLFLGRRKGTPDGRTGGAVVYEEDERAKEARCRFVPDVTEEETTHYALEQRVKELERRTE